MMKILSAPAEKIALIDEILMGKSQDHADGQKVNNRLLSIRESCQYLNVRYTKLYRIIKDGLLDVVDATGGKMIREESLSEYAHGLRKPTPEVLARRAAANAARRERYQNRPGARNAPSTGHIA
ncbi:MAG: helix-turn-helix domain-containing protein [Kiritimatiellae bacterium]|nr:helix-turn-helix domain-containing protein [Kiritimatiellia bacterium]